jgi:hypothetical protein
VSAHTITEADARELCARLGRSPETVAKQCEGNALFLESVRAYAGARIERDNARLFSSLAEAGKVGI